MSSSPVSDATNAVREGVSAVSEIVQIAKQNEHAREAGDAVAKSLSVVATSVYNVLLPFRWLNIYGMRAHRYIDEKFAEEFGERVDEIPEADRVEPKAHVAGSIMQGIFETVDEDELRKLYLNLLAASMDGRVASKVHPAFSAIVRQLSPEELPGLIGMIGSNVQDHDIADIQMRDVNGAGYTQLRHIVRSIEHPSGALPADQFDHAASEQISAWVENWSRLGLIELDRSRIWDSAHSAWVKLRPEYRWAGMYEGALGYSRVIDGYMIRVTALGFAFARAIGAKKD